MYIISFQPLILVAECGRSKSNKEADGVAIFKVNVCFNAHFLKLLIIEHHSSATFPLLTRNMVPKKRKEKKNLCTKNWDF